MRGARGGTAHVFLATFLIGLREGLEASLIVGILAAFLKRNNSSLRPLVGATVAAVLLSIGVGVALELLAQSLPQAQQEALETIIGVVAVVFVTTMILWMNTNARSMKASLEAEAATSLSKGGETAMAGMAFLAVIKEGFETAVFLMAAFNAASGGQQALGLGGAAVGILLACVIGYLIFLGGVKFNLGTFFKVTGPFLILVAAGFVANVFRTGHEAGWVNIGQLQVFDFSAVISNDSVVGALITGMFSIQADPRLVEVLAWFAYLVPVMTVYCWPQSMALSFEGRQKVKRVAVGLCLAAAVGMFVLVPRGATDVGGSVRPVESDDGSVTQVELTSTEGDDAVLTVSTEGGETKEVVLSHVSDGELDGLPLAQWEASERIEPDSSLPTEVTLAQLRDLNGGKIPSGLNVERTPGPFQAEWSESATYSARTSSTSLLRASCTAKLLATLSGGGIDGTKTVSVSGALDDGWEVSESETEAVETALKEAQLAAQEMRLWWLWCPVALAGVAVGLACSSAWDVRKRAKAGDVPAEEAAVAA